MKKTHFEEVLCQMGRTLRDPFNHQLMHSQIGPEAEAELIYLGPSQIRKKLAIETDRPLILWDVGMGIAGNSALAWKLAHSDQSKRPLDIHSFDISTQGLQQALTTIDHFPYLQGLDQGLERLIQEKCWLSQNHRWSLHQGPFQDRLKKNLVKKNIPHPDLIYWDFYSPRTCPQLWSFELFQTLFSNCLQTRLLTYSAATPVRVALLLAGFSVGVPFQSGVATALKSECTVALSGAETFSESENPLGLDWLKKLERSSQFRPYGQSDWSTEKSVDSITAQLRLHPQFQTS